MRNDEGTHHNSEGHLSWGAVAPQLGQRVPQLWEDERRSGGHRNSGSECDTERDPLPNSGDGGGAPQIRVVTQQLWAPNRAPGVPLGCLISTPLPTALGANGGLRGAHKEGIHPCLLLSALWGPMGSLEDPGRPLDTHRHPWGTHGGSWAPGPVGPLRSSSRRHRSH